MLKKNPDQMFQRARFAPCSEVLGHLLDPKKIIQTLNPPKSLLTPVTPKSRRAKEKGSALLPLPWLSYRSSLPMMRFWQRSAVGRGRRHGVQLPTACLPLSFAFGVRGGPEGGGEWGG